MAVTMALLRPSLSFFLFGIFSSLILTVNAQLCLPPTSVSVACLLTYSGSYQLPAVARSAEIAWKVCQAVRNPQRPPGVPPLSLYFFDSGDTQETALKVAIEAVSNRTVAQDVVAFLGPLVSDQSIVTSYVSNVYALPQFDIATTSSISPDRFPYYVRGRLSTASQSQLWPLVLNLMGVRQVSVLASDNVYGDFYTGLALVLTEAGIQVQYTRTIPSGPQPQSLFDGIWSDIKAINTRYVMVFVNEASHVFGILSSGWISGALQPSDDRFYMLGFGSALTTLSLINARARYNVVFNISNSAPGSYEQFNGSTREWWGVPSSMSLEDVIQSLEGTMVLFDTAPTTLNSVGVAYNETRMALYGRPLTDLNTEANIADLCFTAFDAIERAVLDGQLCRNQTVSTRGKTLMEYILATNTTGILGHLSYSNITHDLNIQQGIFNIVPIRSDDGLITFDMKLSFAFVGDIADGQMNATNITFVASDLVTPLTRGDVQNYLATTYDWGRLSTSPLGIPGDGLVIPSVLSKNNTTMLVLETVLPLGFFALLLLAFVLYLRLSAPTPLREMPVREIAFEGVYAWLPSYALAEGTVRGFKVMAQVYTTRKGLFKSRKERITVLSTAEESHSNGLSGFGSSAAYVAPASKKLTVPLPSVPSNDAKASPAVVAPGDNAALMALQAQRRKDRDLKSLSSRGVSSLYVVAEDECPTAIPEDPEDVDVEQGFGNPWESWDKRKSSLRPSSVEKNGRASPAADLSGSTVGNRKDGHRPPSVPGQPPGAPGAPADGHAVATTKGEANGKGAANADLAPSYSVILLQLKQLVLEKQAKDKAKGNTIAETTGALGPIQATKVGVSDLGSLFGGGDEDPLFEWEEPTCDNEMLPEGDGTVFIDLSSGIYPMGRSAADATSGFKVVAPRAHQVLLTPVGPAPAADSNGSAPTRTRAPTLSTVSVAAGTVPARADSLSSSQNSGATDGSRVSSLLQSLGIKHFLLSDANNDPDKWIQLLGQLRSSHIVLALGYARSNHEVILLREEMASGSLADLMALKVASALDQDGKLRVLVDLARGISYLKSLTEQKKGKAAVSYLRRALGGLRGGVRSPHAELVHGRVMPSNLFLDKKLNLKLGLNIAIPFLPSRELVVYSAPEVLRGGAPSSATDVYQLGMLMIELLTGVTPFEGLSDAEVLEGVKSGRLRPTLPPGLPAAFGDLVLFCTAVAEKHRPSIEDLVQELERYSFYRELDQRDGLI